MATWRDIEETDLRWKYVEANDPQFPYFYYEDSDGKILDIRSDLNHKSEIVKSIGIPESVTENLVSLTNAYFHENLEKYFFNFISMDDYNIEIINKGVDMEIFFKSSIIKKEIIRRA